jgi:hypothetical protein
MKLNRIAIAVCAMLSLAAAPASAQGLGGLIKKAKQILTSESKTAVAATAQAAGKKGTLTAVEGGGTLRNPLASIVDVQLVGAYGRSTSTNYGVVTLVFKVKMIANLTQLRLGGNSSYPAIMVDQDDNAYKMKVDTGWYTYDVTEGVYMKVKLKETNEFADVKKTATTIKQLQLGISTSYDDTGLLVLNNVPIHWDEMPE